MAARKDEYKIVILVDAKTGEASLKKLGESGKQFSDSLKKQSADAGKAGMAFDDLQRKVLRLAGAYGLYKLGKSFFDTAQAAEQLNIQLVNITGSAKAGQELRKELVQLGLEMPFTISDVAAGATKMMAVMKGGKKELMEWMPLVADVAARAGLSFQDASTQIIRMYSAGAASAKIIRQKGILPQLGFEIGVHYSPMQTRKKMMEFYYSAESTLRGLSAQLMETTGGQLSNLQDRWEVFQKTLMGVDVGEDNVKKGGITYYLLESLKRLNDKMIEFSEDGTLERIATQIGDIFAKLTDGFMKMIEFIADHPDAIKNGLGILVATATIIQLKNVAVHLWDIGSAIAGLGKKMAGTKAVESLMRLSGLSLKGLLAQVGLMAVLFGEIYIVVKAINAMSSAKNALTASGKAMSKVNAILDSKRDDPEFMKYYRESLIKRDAAKNKGLEGEGTMGKGSEEGYDYPEENPQTREEILTQVRALTGNVSAIRQAAILKDHREAVKGLEELQTIHEQQGYGELNIEDAKQAALAAIRNKYAKEDEEKKKQELEKEKKRAEDWIKAWVEANEELEKELEKTYADQTKNKQTYWMYQRAVAGFRDGGIGTATTLEDMIHIQQRASGKGGIDQRSEMQAKRDADLDLLRENNADKINDLRQAGFTELEIETWLSTERRRINQEYNDWEKEQERLKIEAAKELVQTRIDYLANGFGKLAQIANNVAQMGGKNQAKAFRAYQIFSLMETAISTASAVMKAYKEPMLPYPANLAWAGIVGAMGATQMSMIASQKPPSYAKGGISWKKELAWVGEDKPEAHVPLAGGSIPVRFNGGGARTTNIILQNPTFQDQATLMNTMQSIAAVTSERITPGAFIKNYRNDGDVRRLLQTGR
jgi:hypothetical protein